MTNLNSIVTILIYKLYIVEIGGVRGSEHAWRKGDLKERGSLKWKGPPTPAPSLKH